MVIHTHPPPPRFFPAAVPIAQDLQELGFGIMATYNTAAHLRKAGLTNIQSVLKVQEGRPNAGTAWQRGLTSLAAHLAKPKLC